MITKGICKALSSIKVYVTALRKVKSAPLKIKIGNDIEVILYKTLGHSYRACIKAPREMVITREHGEYRFEGEKQYFDFKGDSEVKNVG